MMNHEGDPIQNTASWVSINTRVVGVTRANKASGSQGWITPSKVGILRKPNYIKLGGERGTLQERCVDTLCRILTHVVSVLRDNT